MLNIYGFLTEQIDFERLIEEPWRKTFNIKEPI